MPPADDTPSTAASPSTSTQYVALPQPQNPGKFTGLGDIDVEEWLKMYERVSMVNRWDPTIMLANVVFYLDGTPRTWFYTHEEELTSWDSFKEKLTDLFGNPTGRQLAAKQELANRVQSATEPYVAYIQDVLALCHKIDTSMPELDKVGHILKGIADDAFNLLVFRNLSTVDAIMKECRRFEQAKSRRIANQFTRLPNTAATSSCTDPTEQAHLPPSNENVTRIVRRELEAAFPVSSQQTPWNNATETISLIKSVVRQEVANMGLPTACSLSRPDIAPAPMARYYRSPPYGARYRNSTAWRTSDDKPICFCCGRIGHVSYHCRSRWSYPPRSTYWESSSPRSASPRRSFDVSDAATSARRYARSPSPQRRQSRPSHLRRSSSPTYSGPIQPEN